MVSAHQNQRFVIGALSLLRFQIIGSADRLVLLLAVAFAIAVTIVSKVCIHLGGHPLSFCYHFFQLCTHISTLTARTVQKAYKQAADQNTKHLESEPSMARLGIMQTSTAV